MFDDGIPTNRTRTETAVVMWPDVTVTRRQPATILILFYRVSDILVLIRRSSFLALVLARKTFQHGVYGSRQALFYFYFCFYFYSESMAEERRRDAQSTAMQRLIVSFRWEIGYQSGTERSIHDWGKQDDVQDGWMLVSFGLSLDHIKLALLKWLLDRMCSGT